VDGIQGRGREEAGERLLFILLYVCRRGAIVSTFCPVQVEERTEAPGDGGQVTLGSGLNGAQAAYMH